MYSLHDTQAVVVGYAVGCSVDLDMRKWHGMSIDLSTLTLFRTCSMHAQQPGQLIFATLAILSCYRISSSGTALPSQFGPKLGSRGEGSILTDVNDLLEGNMLDEPERIAGCLVESLLRYMTPRLSKYIRGILLELGYRCGVVDGALDGALDRYCHLRACRGADHSDALARAVEI